MPKSSRFTKPLKSQRVQGSQTLLKPTLQHFHLNFQEMWEKLSMITSLLVISKTLGLFGNTMTADHMYFCHRWEKFTKQVQTQLSQKQKTFSGNFIAFLEPGENFRHFEKKDHLHSINISEFIEPRKCSYLNARKLLFWNTFPESTCSRITNIAETYTAALLSKFLINLKENDLENMSLSHIKNVTTVWFHVDCGSHVFSS